MCKYLNGSEVRVKKIELPNYISPFILKVNNYKNLQQLKKKKKSHTCFEIFQFSTLHLWRSFKWAPIRWSQLNILTYVYNY